MRWKEKKKLIKIKKMNKRDYTTEEHRVSQRIFFPHHTKDENPVKLCVLCGENSADMNKIHFCGLYGE